MFHPHHHYLILTRRFTSMVQKAGLGLFTHDDVRRATVAALSEVGYGWQPIESDQGESYVVSVTMRETPLVLRVVFAKERDGSGMPRRAPDGRKSIVFVTHAYAPATVER